VNPSQIKRSTYAEDDVEILMRSLTTMASKHLIERPEFPAQPCWLRRKAYCVESVAADLRLPGRTAKGYAQNSLPEYQVKAAYSVQLYQIRGMPADASRIRWLPIVIGVVGDDPLETRCPRSSSERRCRRDLVIRRFTRTKTCVSQHPVHQVRLRKAAPQILTSLHGPAC